MTLESLCNTSEGGWGEEREEENKDKESIPIIIEIYVSSGKGQKEVQGHS